jgi:ABC-type multidrug transport system ATPase subunit
LFRIALPKPFTEKPLSNGIKGLMAFTEHDGGLFVTLGRVTDLNELNNYIEQKTPLVAMMGESGAGKTSLFRAGLSHILINTDIPIHLL